MRLLLQTEKDLDSIVSEISVNDDMRGLRNVFRSETFEARATETGTLLVILYSSASLLAAAAGRRVTGSNETVLVKLHASEGDAVTSYLEMHLQNSDRLMEGMTTTIHDIADLAETVISREVALLAENYRRMIRDDLPSGKNLAVKTALNRVRVQERFLAGLDMANRSQACELLRLSKSNPSATLKRIEDRGGLIRIDRDSRPFYPLFQFDVENGRIHPVIAEINRHRPEGWSNIRLSYWLTRKHADFGRAPAELFGHADEEILDAFRRATLPEVHG
ncbi:hypothetical protein [Paracoccus sp. ME4]|uniref:hypothetical protein n=1 Tax=Paracoccus sp. ME4 TaxID=3138066 RepID=UPI00398AE7E4